MKKHWLFTTLLAIALCVICLVLFPTAAKAASVDDLTFTLNSDGQSYAVKDCSGSASGSLEIPATYNGKPVTEIADSAFSGCSRLTTITIPDSVTSIGSYAVYSCTSLTSITIPNGVTSIDDYAFYCCASLTSITIPDSVTSIGNHAFYSCNSLSSVIIPDGVTSIGSFAFYNCDSLTSVTIPDSVTSIGSSAFYSCDSLTSVNIPDNVTSISDYAFYNCDSLTSVTIPDSVTSIGNSAFYSCDSLTSVTIPDSVTSIGNSAFYNCDGLTSVTIPDNVTSIGSSAFEDCDGLTSVTIPDNVTSIGSSAFEDCSSLTSVTIGNSVTSIGDSAFSGCYSLTDVYISNPSAWCNIAIENYFTNPMYYADRLHILDNNGNEATRIILDSTVTAIPDYAFKGCTSLTSVTIPDSVTSIGDSAFRYCRSLTSITIPDSVTSIGNYAFEYCYISTHVYYAGTERKWEEIEIDSGNTRFDYATIHYNHTHDYSLIPAVTVPATCTEAGYTEYTCAYGEKLRADYVPALGHIKGTDAVVVAPTCGSRGYTESTCPRCKLKVQTDYVDSLGHDFSGKETVVAPKCTEEGYTSVQCTRCTEITKKDYVESVGHSMVYKAAEAATCTKDGHTEGTLCSRCGLLGTATQLAKGHSYTTTTTKATLSKDGSIVKKCSVCGDVASTTTIARPTTFTLSTTDYTYNGAVKTPGVTIKDANGKVLTKGTDYTVTYPSGRTALGTYTVTITMKGNYSGTKTLTFNIKLGTPNVTVANATNGVKVSWGAISGAKTYTVYRSVYSGGAWSGWKAIKTGVTGTSYTDTAVKSNANVKYTVRAVNGSHMSAYKSSSAIKFLATPNVTVSNATNGVKVSWGAISGAKTYTVYRSVYTNGAWSGWKAIKTGVTGTTYTDTAVKSNANVKYTVKAINGNFTSYIKSSSAIKFLATPTVKATNAATGVTVTWDKITGAKTYTVYRSVYSGGKWSGWTAIKTGVTGTSYTDTTVKSGATVRYTVKAINSSFTSYVKASNTTKYLAQPKVTVAKVTGGIKASWAKINGASGYIVYRRTYSGGKWGAWEKVKVTTALSFTDTTAKTGVYYQYTVRAYSGDYKSSYTNSSSIKR